MTSPTLAQIVEHGPVSTGDRSVAEHLRRSARAIRRRSTKAMKIPGYDNLFAVFRALKDYREVREEFQQVFGGPRRMDETETEIQTAIIQLLLSSVGSYAIVDGEKHEIGLPLGLDLYDYIWPPEDEDEARPATDAEALILLFDSNTVQITSLAAQLDRWFQDTSVQADEEILGN